MDKVTVTRKLDGSEAVIKMTVIGENGQPLPMSCASAGSTSMQATAAIIGDRTGRKISTTSLSYVGNHISLGRNDGIFQLVDGPEWPWKKRRVLMTSCSA